LAKVVSTDRSLRVTVVKEAVELLGIGKGDKVAFLVDDKGRVYLTKA